MVGTYANRMVHRKSDSIVTGPHVIDPEGQVRTFRELVDIRLTATCRHLQDPADKVYFLGMEGEFFEANVRTMDVTFLADLLKELAVHGKTCPHFKDAFTNHGRVVVANNSYYPKDFLDPDDCNGRLAEWDGNAWTLPARTGARWPSTWRSTSWATDTGSRMRGWRPTGDMSTHVFPTGFSAHWVRLASRCSGVLTAQFMYR